MYSLKTNLVNEVTGRHVQYRKPGSGRNGWRGVISAVNTARLTVLFNNAVVQEYRLDAVDWTTMNVSPKLLEELRKIQSVSPEYAYLYADPIGPPVEEGESVPDRRKFVVAGATGGEPRFYQDQEAAEEGALQLAQRSKSGQAVRVYRCVTEFQRSEPPVERRDMPR